MEDTHLLLEIAAGCVAVFWTTIECKKVQQVCNVEGPQQYEHCTRQSTSDAVQSRGAHTTDQCTRQLQQKLNWKKNWLLS
eukprot:3491967-Amphidinium_carterae.2